MILDSNLLQIYFFNNKVGCSGTAVWHRRDDMTKLLKYLDLQLVIAAALPN